MNSDNIFRKYHLVIKGLYDQGALSTSTGILAPEMPPNVAILLRSLEDSAKQLGRTVNLAPFARGNAKEAIENQTRMLESIREIGFVLKDRGSMKAGFLLKRSPAEKAYSEYLKRDLTELVRAAQFVYKRNVMPSENYTELSSTNLSNQDGDFIRSVKEGLHEYSPDTEVLLGATKRLMARRKLLGLGAAGAAWGLYEAERATSSWLGTMLDSPYKTMGFRNFEESGDLHPRMQEVLDVMESNMHHRGMNRLMLREDKADTKTLRPKKSLVQSRVLVRGGFFSPGDFKTPEKPRSMRDPETNSPAAVTEEQVSSLHACSILTKAQADALRARLDQMKRISKDTVLQNTLVESLSEGDKRELKQYYNIPDMDSLLAFKNLEDRTPSEINAFLSINLKPLADIINARGPAEAVGGRGRN